MPERKNTAAKKLISVVEGKTGGHPTVNLFISGIRVTALIDTGASCSLLQHNVSCKLVNKVHRTFYLSSCKPLQGIGGIPLVTMGA